MRGCAWHFHLRSTGGARRSAQGTATFMKYVGGLMRPGSAWATPEGELATLPGFSRDMTAARAEARRLLAEAGVSDLKLGLLVRGIPMPHFAAADLLTQSLARDRGHDDAAAAQYLGMAEDCRSRRFRRGARLCWGFL